MSALQLGQVQSSGSRLAAIVELVKQLARNKKHQTAPLHVIEVGSYEGQSACALRDAITTCPAGGSLLCIDPWEPYLFDDVGNHPAMDADLRDGRAFERFKHNIFAGWSAWCPVTWHKGTFASALENNAITQPKGLVYIDGAHDYFSVLADIECAIPLVEEGGIICGDDCEAPITTVEQALALEPFAKHEYWEGQHPGVALALWKAFGTMTAPNGVWAVRMRGGRFFDVYAEEGAAP